MFWKKNKLKECPHHPSISPNVMDEGHSWKSINLQPQTVFQECPSFITSTMSMALEIPYLLNAFTIVFFGSSIHAARIYWHMVGRSVFFLVRLGCSCVIQHPLILFSLKVAGANLDWNFRETSFLSLGN